MISVRGEPKETRDGYLIGIRESNKGEVGKLEWWLTALWKKFLLPSYVVWEAHTVLYQQGLRRSPLSKWCAEKGMRKLNTVHLLRERVP